jgi:predicted site-specific integrase-resolvase
MQQPLRTAIYARVSSEPQTDGNSMASQIAALEARVAADGLRLPAAQRFVDDGYELWPRLGDGGLREAAYRGG